MEPQIAPELGGVLREAGYSAGAVAAAIGARGPVVAVRASDVPTALRQLAADPPLSTLVRLFLLAQPVVQEEADAALAPLSVERLEQAGVLEASEGVRAAVRVVPYDGLLLACDPEPRGERGPDYVPPPNLSSVELDRLVPPRRAASALDIGTGTGLQALRAAAHSERVVATDLNVRALEVAAFGAALNGIENVELRAGTMFEPVEGERFDLVVCNPPFVISPESQLLYRDSDLPGDALCEEIVRRIPSFLNTDGFACVLVSWALRSGEEWSEPLRRWIDGSGCDSFLLHFRTDKALQTAYAWRPEAPEPWLEYYRGLGIDSIGYGAIVLRRRREAAAWVRAEQLPADRSTAGREVAQLFQTQDTLAGLSLSDPGGLLDLRLRLAERQTLREASAPGDGSWELREMQVELDGGLRFRAGIDPLIARLLPLCDGGRTLGETLHALSDELDVPEAERDQFVRHVLPPVRRLLELGFLVPS